jgi:hypothetical protein
MGRIKTGGRRLLQKWYIDIIFREKKPGIRSEVTYFLVFCSNGGPNQDKKSTQACWKTPTKKLGPATPFLKKLRGRSILDDTKCLVNKSGPMERTQQ